MTITTHQTPLISVMILMFSAKVAAKRKTTFDQRSSLLALKRFIAANIFLGYRRLPREPL
jgi:hypothetical protein